MSKRQKRSGITKRKKARTEENKSPTGGRATRHSAAGTPQGCYLRASVVPCRYAQIQRNEETRYEYLKDIGQDLARLRPGEFRISRGMGKNMPRDRHAYPTFCELLSAILLNPKAVFSAQKGPCGNVPWTAPPGSAFSLISQL